MDFTSDFKWAEPYPEIYKICTLFSLNELSNPKNFAYIPLQSFLQDGPQCGLVALAMLRGDPTKDSVNEIFQYAKGQSFTFNGEMFSAENMGSLAKILLKGRSVEVYSGDLNSEFIKEKLLQGMQMLAPYDTNKDNSPGLHRGHKAHWCAVSGALETSSDFFILARHGKARNVQIWRLEDLAKKCKLEEKKKEKYVPKPFITFKGKVNYVSNFTDCAFICDNLLKVVNDSPDDEVIIGFDMEWPFSFQTGPGKTALIQISHNLETAYLLHVSEMKTVPQGLIEFLHHPKVRLTGVCIKNDVRKLLRDFAGFDPEQILPKCIDSSVLANTVLPVTQRWSMEKLINYVLKMRINKDKKVRMSKWHVIPLSKYQQVYAAIDVYASLLLYHELKKVEKENIQREIETQQKIEANDPTIFQSL